MMLVDSICRDSVDMQYMIILKKISQNLKNGKLEEWGDRSNDGGLA